jgi:hypothetical protein
MGLLGVQATQCLTLVVNATVQVLNNLATIGSTPDEHLWYVWY